MRAAVGSVVVCVHLPRFALVVAAGGPEVLEPAVGDRSAGRRHAGPRRSVGDCASAVARPALRTRCRADSSV